MSSGFKSGTHFVSQLIEREHVDQAAPGKLAPLALHALQMAATLKNRQRFVVPEQLRDRERIWFWVDVGGAHYGQRDASVDLIDAHDAPPAWDARSAELAVGGDEPRAVEHLRVATALPRPAIECVCLALDFIAREFAVDERNVNADTAFAEAKLIKDEGIFAGMLSGQVLPKRDADVVIVHPWGL